MATFHRSETACRHFLNSLFQSDKIDKWSFYLPNQISGTYCPKTSTRPPSCGIVFFMTILDLYFRISNYINITTNIVRWCHLKLVIQIPSFFSPLIDHSAVIHLVQKNRQVKSSLHPGKKTWIQRDLNHQPPDIIHDALDHRTTVPWSKFRFFGNCFLWAPTKSCTQEVTSTYSPWSTKYSPIFTWDHFITPPHHGHLIGQK